MRPASPAEAFLDAAERGLRREPPVWPDAIGPPRGDHAIDLRHGWDPEATPPRRAAVLVPVIRRQDGDAHLLFTERAAGLRQHSGQISFPGGKMDPGETPLEAALREAEEEIGLDPALVRPLGYLDGYLSGTGFFIVPMVGLLEGAPPLALNPAEVASAFEVPLGFVLDAANHAVHTRRWQGGERQHYAMPFGDHYIWGVTAGILRNLHERLTLPWSG